MENEKWKMKSAKCRSEHFALFIFHFSFFIERRKRSLLCLDQKQKSPPEFGGPSAVAQVWDRRTPVLSPSLALPQN